MSPTNDETIDAEPGAMDSEFAEETVFSLVEDPARPPASSQMPEPEPGALIGRYVVLSRLGSGAMGVVLAAYDPELDRRVAIKLLRHRRRRHREAARARLQREAQALAKLNHQNVVGVHDVGLHADQVFVAMEYVEGQTLADWMRTAPEGGPRPWREVLAHFEAAGRGLAAAHAQGLIHRDFKPDNVMVGTDGRVRVMDFGLARADDEEDEVDLEDVPALPEGVDAGQLSALETPLTQTGAVMGTPAYMSPEQLTGMGVTARSDQWGFCVSLFEALYGERPFKGDTLAGLALSVTQAKFSLPRAHAVPSWFEPILRRGLSSKSSQRWETMEALLDALRRGETARKRRHALLGVLAASLVAAGILGFGAWQERQLRKDCQREAQATAELWSPDRRATIRAAILGTEMSYAEQTAELALPYFDRQLEALRDATLNACLAERVEKRWDTELVARADWCLDERRIQLDTLASELAEVEGPQLSSTIRAASTLHPVEPCFDETRLKLGPPPPADRETATRIRRQLWQASARSSAGKAKEGLPLAEAALADAEALGWTPLVAAARWHLGSLLAAAGEYKRAESEFEEAYFEASTVSAHAVASRAATDLTFTVGFRDSRHAEGRRWARLAEVAFALMNEPESSLRRGRLLNALALTEHRGDAHDRAIELHQQAYDMRRELLGDDHPELAVSLNNLGLIYAELARYDEAIEAYQRAAALKEEAFGKDHPTLASSLSNLANTYYALGQYEEAKELHLRSLHIRERSLGADHPTIAVPLTNLGNVNNTLGHYAEAKAMFERALEIDRKAVGDEHPYIATGLYNLAGTERDLGNDARSEELYRQSLAMREKVLGKDHTEVAVALNAIANIARGKGEYAEAKAMYERALTIREEALGPDHVRLGYSLAGLAKLELERGRVDAAVPYAERCLKLRSGDKTQPEMVAEAQWLVAQALWASGQDRERALELALAARDTYRSVKMKAADAAEIGTWLEAR